MNDDRTACTFPISYPSRTIEKGINLTSGGAGNYAHFITEVVPRLIAIDRSDLYNEYPLIVDGWIGSALTEILVYFNKKCRQIIALAPFENVLVENLIHISAPVFAPQDFLKNTIYNKKNSKNNCRQRRLLSVFVRSNEPGPRLRPKIKQS